MRTPYSGGKGAIRGCGTFFACTLSDGPVELPADWSASVHAPFDDGELGHLPKSLE